MKPGTYWINVGFPSTSQIFQRKIVIDDNGIRTIKIGQKITEHFYYLSFWLPPAVLFETEEAAKENWPVAVRHTEGQVSAIYFGGRSVGVPASCTYSTIDGEMINFYEAEPA